MLGVSITQGGGFNMGICKFLTILFLCAGFVYYMAEEAPLPRLGRNRERRREVR
jgi:hypothetical protein